MPGNVTHVDVVARAEPCRIRVGNQTAIAAKRFMEPFAYALANGFDAFEWFPDPKPGVAGWDERDLDSMLRQDVRQAACARGIRLSVHARGVLPLPGQRDRLLRRAMQLTEDLGASVFVIHLRPEVTATDFARALLAPLRGLASKGVQVAVENTPAATPEHCRNLFGALRELNPPELPHVGMCQDIGHANLCPATHNDYLGYLDQLGDGVPINHVHVHENWGEADTHLTLLTGPSALDNRGVGGLLRRLRQRGFSGSLILEQWPQPPSLLNRARDTLLEMWQTLDAPAPAPAAGTACKRNSIPAATPFGRFS